MAGVTQQQADLQALMREMEALRAEINRRPMLRWAYIVDDDPLTIRFEDETQPMLGVPSTLMHEHEIGQRVRCAVQLGSVTILGAGKPGPLAIPDPATYQELRDGTITDEFASPKGLDDAFRTWQPITDVVPSSAATVSNPDPITGRIAFAATPWLALHRFMKPGWEYRVVLDVETNSNSNTLSNWLRFINNNTADTSSNYYTRGFSHTPTLGGYAVSAGNAGAIGAVQAGVGRVIHRLHLMDGPEVGKASLCFFDSYAANGVTYCAGCTSLNLSAARDGIQFLFNYSGAFTGNGDVHILGRKYTV